ncbi:MAG: hypothetical protein JXB05_23355 [Myxococcaceae bacterium]|nr:hypothetical protein [Myxococcaceae bacterium]
MRLRSRGPACSFSGTVLTPGEARQRELGAPGSQATLSIRRDGQPRSVTLTRAR